MPGRVRQSLREIHDGLYDLFVLPVVDGKSPHRRADAKGTLARLVDLDVTGVHSSGDGVPPVGSAELKLLFAVYELLLLFCPEYAKLRFNDLSLRTE